MAWTFEELRKELMRARNPTTVGRKVMPNTKLLLLNGTKEQPAGIGVRFYETMILKFWEDGAIDVADSRTSRITLSRIWVFAGANIWRRKLPTITGRRPSVDSHLCISKGDGIPAIFCSKGGYVRIRPNGEIDLDTVHPLTVEVFTSVKEFNHRRKKAVPILQSIFTQARLGRFKATVGGEGTFSDWLNGVLDKPLHEIDFADMPFAGTQLAIDVFVAGKPYGPINKAAILGCTRTVKIKELSC